METKKKYLEVVSLILDQKIEGGSIVCHMDNDDNVIKAFCINMRGIVYVWPEQDKEAKEFIYVRNEIIAHAEQIRGQYIRKIIELEEEIKELESKIQQGHKTGQEK